MMTRRALVPFAVVLALGLSVPGCADTGEDDAETTEMDAGAEMTAGDPFEGTHEMSMGTVEMADGRYTYRSAEGDSLIAEGTYAISGDTVRLTETLESSACAGDVGVYTFTGEGEDLTLTLVEDPCEGRREDITGDTTGTPGA